MSNIFASVDRMGTGAKLFFVAIGVLIMLAYSLENQPVAQQPAQTQTSTPAPVSAPAPSAAPSPEPRPAARSTAKKQESKSVAVNNADESLPSATPATDTITPIPKPLTNASPAPVVVPENAPAEIAPESLIRPSVTPNDLPPQGYFTVGSTKDDVLQTQGTPKAMNENRWTYGLSSIEFQNGRVVTWNVSPLNPLKAVLLPTDQAESTAARARGYFTVGSTKDDVIGVQGTPTRFSDTHWTYGLSSVEFNAGTVTGWNDSPLNPLRARLLPADQAGSNAAKTRGYLTVGSTKDEVIGVQGTPSRFSDTHWAYGLSSIEFQNGQVTTWNMSPLNPIRAALIPQNPEDASTARARGYFTVGSTKDEVLGVQGTPARFSDTYWAYGLSSVSFQNGRVTSWKSSPLNPLKARNQP
jgi:outer membrane protein assembly factor BamE (lipoprotein component of BamABCDE complex)